MNEIMTNVEFSLLMLAGVLIGFTAIMIAFGSIGRSNVFRCLMILYSALLCAGYLTQHFVYEEPSNFAGFPLMGVVCWGGIGLMQILHIRLNIQRRRLDEEFAVQRRKLDEDYKKWTSALQNENRVVE